MKVPFERVAQLIAVGALDRSSPLLSILSVHIPELQLEFKDYVKSQIHLYVVGDLYSDRTMQDYIDALEYLEHGHGDVGVIYRVLYFFYTDMLNFLVMNKENVSLTLNLPAWLKQFSLNEDAIKDKYNALASMCTRNFSFDELTEFIRSFDCSEFFDYIDSLQDISNRLDSCATAILLLKQLKLLEEKCNGIQSKSCKL